jgi:3'(2'), 5'-bisphosphate nucleotidase
VADFAAQAILILRLRQDFPDVPVVAEEDADELRARPELGAKVVACVQASPGCEALSAEQIFASIDAGRASPPGRAQSGPNVLRYFWCIDPIDGTKGFLRNDQYAVCLGLVEVSPDGSGAAVLGVLGCPNLTPVRATGDKSRGAILYGCRGLGAHTCPMDDGESITIAVARTSAPDTVCVESVEPGHTNQAANAALCAAVRITSPPVRMDSQCKYAVVARGEAGLYLRSSSKPQNIWDHAAGAAIVTEAGGCVTDDRGVELDFGAGRQLVRNTTGLVTSHGGTLHGLVVRNIAIAGASGELSKSEEESGEDFGDGLRLRAARDERDVQGAAALLEMCDVEFMFSSGSGRESSWAERVQKTAAGIRSYLPSDREHTMDSLVRLLCLSKKLGIT